MQALLSFENAPPFAAPLRFFLTAPLFAAAAGVLLALLGPEMLLSRWSPASLAATHLLTLGFMLMVMIGALIQILPVVAGASIRRPLHIARLVHVALCVGAIALVGGLLFQSSPALSLAVVCLLTGALIFVAAAGSALYPLPATSPTIAGLKLSLPALLATLILGSVLALGLGQDWQLPLLPLTDLHAAWGLGAWSLVLLAAVSYVVVPMFQLTPGYPSRPAWWFPRLLLGAVVLWSVSLLLESELGQAVMQVLVLLLALGFAVQTLRLQAQRRRARQDVVYYYWQFGLLAGIFGLLLALTVTVLPNRFNWPGLSVLLGIALLAAFCTCICGMLYKILPFLGWMHLQQQAQGKGRAPAMNKLLPDRQAMGQMVAGIGAWGLLCLAAIWPEALARVAGGAFALAHGWLFANLYLAVRRYRHALSEIGQRATV